MSLLASELSNKKLIPAIFLGTAHLLNDQDETEKAVKHAINIGYCGIDTAYLYNNIRTISKVIRNYIRTEYNLSFIPTKKFKLYSYQEFISNLAHPNDLTKTSKSVFITNKIWWNDFNMVGLERTINEHLFYFNCNSIDLLLLHWPGIAPWFEEYNMLSESFVKSKNCDNKRIEMWMMLEKLYKNGVVKAIGVSNYMAKHLKPLISNINKRMKNGDETAVFPMVNQIETSPLLSVDNELLSICDQYNIQIVSYATMARQKKNNDPKVVEVMEPLINKYKVTQQQLFLRHALQKGYIVLPKSKNNERLYTNLNSGNFNIEDEDMKNIDKLHCNFRTCGDPNKIN